MSKSDKDLAVKHIAQGIEEFDLFMKDVYKIVFNPAKELKDKDKAVLQERCAVVEDVMRKKLGETLSRKYHEVFHPKPKDE